MFVYGVIRHQLGISASRHRGLGNRLRFIVGSNHLFTPR